MFCFVVILREKCSDSFNSNKYFFVHFPPSFTFVTFKLLRWITFCITLFKGSEVVFLLFISKDHRTSSVHQALFHNKWTIIETNVHPPALCCDESSVSANRLRTWSVFRTCLVEYKLCVCEGWTGLYSCQKRPSCLHLRMFVPWAPVSAAADSYRHGNREMRDDCVHVRETFIGLLPPTSPVLVVRGCFYIKHLELFKRRACFFHRELNFGAIRCLLWNH